MMRDYAFYVWSSFALTGAVFVALLFHALLERRAARRNAPQDSEKV